MFGHEIVKFFDRHPVFQDIFRGVHAWCDMPVLRDQHYVIINTSNSPKIIGHWMVLGKNNGIIELFDPLGDVNRAKALFISCFPLWPGMCEYNLVPYQSRESTKCGQYCIYFLFNRLLNKDLHCEQVLEAIFVDDHDENEERVTEFMNT